MAGHRTLRALTLLVLASALAILLGPAIVRAAGTPMGFVEVCKQSDGSAVTGTFRFTVGGQSIEVPVGACSAPLQVAAGSLLITEDAVAGIGVTDIAVEPADRSLSRSVATRSVQVTVVAGGVASQTIATFTNRVELGTLTVCKVAGTGITPGTNFTFLAGGHAIAVPAGACSQAGTFPYGSNVAVAEVLEQGTRVTAIGVVPAERVVGTPNPTDGTATVAIGPGVTEVTFTNESVQRGSLQICKRSESSSLTGTFTFTVAGQSTAVAVGSCSPVMDVPVGVVTVTEADRGDSLVTGVTTSPAARLIGSDLSGRSAQVRIVPGGLTQLATVTFTNQVQTSAVKVCKVAGSGVVLGTPFAFTVAGRAVSVPAGSCVLAGNFPLNAPVLVAESIPAGMQVAAIRVDPPERMVGNPSRTDGTVSIRTGPGVTEVSVTNQVISGTTLPVPLSPTTTVGAAAVVSTIPTVPVLPTTTVPTAGVVVTIPNVPVPTTTVGGAPVVTTTTVLPSPTTTVPRAAVVTTTTVPQSPTTTVGAAPVVTTTTVPPSSTTIAVGPASVVTTTVPASPPTTVPCVASTIPMSSSTTILPSGATTGVPGSSSTTSVPGSSSTTSTMSNSTTIPVSGATTLPGSGDTSTISGGTTPATPVCNQSVPPTPPSQELPLASVATPAAAVASRQLALTGWDFWPLLLVGGSMLFLGAAVSSASRRRSLAVSTAQRTGSGLFGRPPTRFPSGSSATMSLNRPVGVRAGSDVRTSGPATQWGVRRKMPWH